MVLVGGTKKEFGLTPHTFAQQATAQTTRPWILRQDSSKVKKTASTSLATVGLFIYDHSHWPEGFLEVVWGFLYLSTTTRTTTGATTSQQRANITTTQPSKATTKTTTAMQSIASLPRIFFWRIILDVAEINWQHFLECVKAWICWSKHLGIVSSKLELQKTPLHSSLAFLNN